MAAEIFLHSLSGDAVLSSYSNATDVALTDNCVGGVDTDVQKLTKLLYCKDGRVVVGHKQMLLFVRIDRGNERDRTSGA